MLRNVVDCCRRKGVWVLFVSVLLLVVIAMSCVSIGKSDASIVGVVVLMVMAFQSCMKGACAGLTDLGGTGGFGIGFDVTFVNQIIDSFGSHSPGYIPKSFKIPNCLPFGETRGFA